jgi:hypothetical protein
MAAIQFNVNEDIFYDHYNNRIGYLIIPMSEYDEKQPAVFDTAVLNCVYKNGQVNGGKYLAPLYRTVTYLSQLNKDYAIISIRP